MTDKDRVEYLTVGEFSKMMMGLVEISCKLRKVDPDLTHRARKALTEAWAGIYDLREIARDLEK